MNSDQIGLAILVFIIISAFYGWYRIYKDLKYYFMRKKKRDSGIIGKYNGNF